MDIEVGEGDDRSLLFDPEIWIPIPRDRPSLPGQIFCGFARINSVGIRLRLSAMRKFARLISIDWRRRAWPSSARFAKVRFARPVEAAS